MIARETVRGLIVSWLSVAAGVHVIIALGMTWFADANSFANYHRQVLASFGFDSASALPVLVMDLQHWWMGLFGATLQAFSLLMLLLIHVGNRYRIAAVWCWMAIIILWWAPQDIFISLQKNAIAHVWADIFALLVLVPPLLWLWWLDRKFVAVNNEGGN